MSKGIPCLSAWAPTLQHPKNVEILAVASPLSNASGMSSGGGSNANSGGGVGGGGGGGGFTSNGEMYYENNASRVYILVFEEGAFSHKDFNLWSDLCDLFGLPMETIQSSSPVMERVKDSGLRRDVFRLMEDRALAGEIAEQEGEKQDSVDRSGNSFGREFLQTLMGHLSKECQNCVRSFQQEIVGDGRLFNDGYSIGGGLLESDYEKKSMVELESLMSDDGRGNNKSSAYTRLPRGDGDKPPSPIKPTIGFQVILPYSSSSMEVTNLEWNADGTTLSIVQRRKGSSSTSNLTSSSVGFNVTNKKKKGSNSPSISPGSTAVSFWSIPEWLLDYDEQASLFEIDKQDEVEEDGLMFKNQGHGYSDDVGWEVEDEDETKSLFPMWEWYLSKYIFKDDLLLGAGASSKKNRHDRVLMKNMVDVHAYPMELTASSSPFTGATSGLSTRHSKKSSVRGGKGSGSSDGSSTIQGDVTCLFWEEMETFSLNKDDNPRQKEKDDDIKSPDKDNGVEGESSAEKKESTSTKKGNTPLISSKWIAIGTSKGQMVLHNSAASYLSNQSKKVKNKSNSNAVNSVPLLSSAQARTITIPSRQKKRITCGAWLENLLVFGSVGSGSLTVVSTFPKIEETIAVNEKNSFVKEKENLFKEKNVKVIGNLVMPGGRDAHCVQMNNFEDLHGSTTNLSINCEGRSLLFYVFPKLIDDPKTASQITSSPAIEISFTMNKSTEDCGEDAFSSQSKSATNYRGGSTAWCGNIIEHYLIPNTFLVLVVFSNGYVALVDWANSVIINDAEIDPSSKEGESSSLYIDRKDLDNRVIIDAAFHLPTCTLVCLTRSGSLFMFYIRISDGCSKEEAENCKSQIGLSISTKTHTRPSKTKSSLSSSRDHWFDREAAEIQVIGTIDKICSKKLEHNANIPGEGRKRYMLNFSADGDSVSVSLGDETVAIFSIRFDEAETQFHKQKLTELIFSGKDQMYVVFILSVCTFVIWLCGMIQYTLYRGMRP